MNKINLFVELIRLKKPIGFMLLFWPCAWGLTIAYNFSGEIKTFVIYLILFLSGAILMRSAGCIINDIADRKFDKKVDRTKNRPIATGAITVTEGFMYSSFLCLLAFIVLIQFNFMTIILAMFSMPLAFTYPLMKRYTYWPQLFLGITFNYGLILGWTSITGQINIVPLILYSGAIFWTLGYDTIYGYQDIKDDEIIGLKSTSIKFKNNPVMFVTLCYFVFLISLLITGTLLELNNFFYLVFVVIILHMTFFQLKKIKTGDSAQCLKIFKSNNFLGLLTFISLLAGKI
ncbi:4-hydroxybenzoate octaprenyltransferase [Candidatus Pelagibacter sp.]|nr:4-hydroxybenzoate octaprenyltransferase [Candidatus Pelagibacter sp.]